MSTIIELNSRGDEVILRWDENNPSQHKTVKRAIDRMLKKGALLFKSEEQCVEVDGDIVMTGKKTGEQIRNSDQVDPAEAQKIVKVNPLAGG